MSRSPKERLIDHLQNEQAQFARRCQSTKDHELTIAYLKTGYYDSAEVDTNELLYAAVFDFDCLCSDYGVS